MKGTFYHITTETKQLQMPFYKFGNKELKIIIMKTVFLGE